MAFRTNLVPAIEERTVSGSSVSFNSAFALPLKACKVSFNATQAGSGEPSPSNPRAISGVSAIGLTANSTPVSVSLGEERYGGELDVVRKKLVVTHGRKLLDGVNYSFNGVWGATTYGYGVYATVSDGKRTLSNEVVCDKFELSTTGYMSMPLYSFYGGSGVANTITFILPNTITSKAEANAWLEDNNVEFTYPLDTPIEISLSDLPTLSTIIGNNSFASDSGSIDLTYKDLDIAKRGNFREVFKLPS